MGTKAEASVGIDIVNFMSEISVRPAEPKDLAAIARIYGDAVQHGTASFEIDPPDQDEMARRFAELSGGSFPYLVAGPYRARPAYRWTGEDSIYVAADSQRRGSAARCSTG